MENPAPLPDDMLSDDAAPVAVPAPSMWHGAVAAGSAGAAAVAALFGPLVDAVLPPRCAGCGAIVQGDGGFCADCWTGLDFLDGPACARCALPFAAPQGDGALCAGCLADPPPYDGVAVPLAYGAATGALVQRLKYGRRIGHAALMARMMRISAQRLLPPGGAEDVVLVPVPLHRWRLWGRGFNQSALMASALSPMLGVPVAIDALTRTRSTGSLRGLGRTARARAVRGAFAVPADRKGAIAGRHVLLVDDVLTTGATAAACARTLLRGGATRVSLVAFARVVPDRADPALDYGGGGADISLHGDG